MHSNLQNAIKNILGDTNYQEILRGNPDILQADFDLDQKQYNSLNTESHSGPRVVAGPEMSASCLCICSGAPNPKIKVN